MAGLIAKVGALYEEVWKAIVRPPRDFYQPWQLGPDEFLLHNRRYKRCDFELLSARNMKLKCSHFEPVTRSEPSPCVIYLHGNCSSRLECIQCGCLRVLLPLGVSVVCFDFAGSGLSDGNVFRLSFIVDAGEYVSLGYYERADVAVVIRHLRSLERVSTIGLWGRSMGAVTACLVAAEDPSIAGLVVDSAFSSLRALSEELANDFLGWQPPRFILSMALNMVRNTVQQKAAFDINHLDIVEAVRKAFMPALFIAAKDDVFIRPHHTEILHEAYAGDKNIIVVEGSHNTQRTDFIHDSIAIFFHFALRLDMEYKGSGKRVHVNKAAAIRRPVWTEVAMELAAREQVRRRQLITSCRVSETSEVSQELIKVQQHSDGTARRPSSLGSKESPQEDAADYEDSQFPPVEAEGRRDDAQAVRELEKLLNEFDLHELVAEDAAVRSSTPASPAVSGLGSQENNQTAAAEDSNNNSQSSAATGGEGIFKMVAPHRARQSD